MTMAEATPRGGRSTEGWVNYALGLLVFLLGIALMLGAFYCGYTMLREVDAQARAVQTVSAAPNPAAPAPSKPGSPPPGRPGHPRPHRRPHPPPVRHRRGSQAGSPPGPRRHRRHDGVTRRAVGGNEGELIIDNR